MRSIGVRELRQQASRYLREVEGGDPIEVTDHGRPVARLIPLPRSGGAEALLESGQLSTANGDLFALGPPLKARKGVVLPSVELAAMRKNER